MNCNNMLNLERRLRTGHGSPVCEAAPRKKGHRAGQAIPEVTDPWRSGTDTHYEDQRNADTNYFGTV